MIVNLFKAHVKNIDHFIGKLDFFNDLYAKCKNDTRFEYITPIRFRARFSSQNTINDIFERVDFGCIVNSSLFHQNPYLSKLEGNILYTLDLKGIHVKVNLILSECFNDPETPYRLFNIYSYLEKEDMYVRIIDNIQAGLFQISGNICFEFGDDDDDIFKISELPIATFKSMNEYLSNNDFLHPLKFKV